MKYMVILSCEGEKSGAVFPDLECCLQRCAEDLFGEVPQDDHPNYEEWRAIEKTLVEEEYISFEDGSISIAKVSEEDSSG